MSTPASPLPWCESQFLDPNGVPLAGGQIFTYAAGTSTPQATYTDATGAVPLPNPVLLDASGRASIWLGPLAYKIVAQDANSVTQWTVDNVADLALGLIAGTRPLLNLVVTDNATIGETLTAATVAATTLTAATASVSGTLTAATLAVTGNETESGTLTVATLDATTVNTSGTETVGTLDVTGNATVAGTLTLGASLITALIAAGSLASVATVAVTGGSWLVATFGTASGARTRIAVGAGTAANGVTIPLPDSGFSLSDIAVEGAALAQVNGTVTHNPDNIALSIASGVVSAASSDYSGNNFPTIAAWWAVLSQTGY
jgi:hypothetical protein